MTISVNLNSINYNLIFSVITAETLCNRLMVFVTMVIDWTELLMLLSVYDDERRYVNLRLQDNCCLHGNTSFWAAGSMVVD